MEKKSKKSVVLVINRGNDNNHVKVLSYLTNNQMENKMVSTVSYSSAHMIVKIPEKSILNEMNNYKIPDDVKIEADRIYKEDLKMGNGLTPKKGDKRKKVILYCIYQAYEKLGRTIDPKSLVKIVGTKNNSMTRSAAQCSEMQTGYHVDIVRKYPSEYIPELFEELGFPKENQKDIIDFANATVKKDNNLLEQYPQTVAAGLINYYCQTRGIIINKNVLSNLSGLSDHTIKKITKEIMIIDNA